MSTVALAQPSLKLYGYSQVTTPGTIRVDIPEEGGEKTKAPLFFTNYYIFISTSSSTTIQPKEIWIDGKWRKTANQETVITPFFSAGPERKILVPFTKLKVTRLHTWDTPGTIKPSATLKKLMKNNELIVSYLWKRKTYYATLKKLTVLEKIHAP
ncbi:MAG TPA: hypothetical protein VMZ03_09390 [Chitinophagaceae bacterium]|nr:hypothetical protein [Chitinophagaceae bacterium]